MQRERETEPAGGRTKVSAHIWVTRPKGRAGTLRAESKKSVGAGSSEGSVWTQPACWSAPITWTWCSEGWPLEGLVPCWAQLSLPRSSAGNIPLLFPTIRSNLVKPLMFRCVCPTRFHMVQSDKPRAFDGRDICYCHLFLCKPYCVVDEILTNQRSCWFYEFNFALPSNSVSHFLESNSKAPK